MVFVVFFVVIEIFRALQFEQFHSQDNAFSSSSLEIDFPSADVRSMTFFMSFFFFTYFSCTCGRSYEISLQTKDQNDNKKKIHSHRILFDALSC